MPPKKHLSFFADTATVIHKRKRVNFFTDAKMRISAALIKKIIGQFLKVIHISINGIIYCSPTT